MAEYISTVADPAAALAEVGVVFERTVDGDAPAEVIAALIPEADRQFVRGEMVATPPVEGASHDGMGAWHVNDVNEVHTVTSGRGLVQFVTNQGVVGVLVGEGDVMTVRKAEHRYLPIEDQGWVIRHGAAPDAEMAPVNTGREDAPWPAV